MGWKVIENSWYKKEWKNTKTYQRVVVLPMSFIKTNSKTPHKTIIETEYGVEEKEHKNKSQALSYAKEYMRTH